MCSTPADRTQFGVIAVLILVCVTLGIVVNNNSDISKVLDEVEERAERTHLDTRSSMFTENYCLGAKPTDDAFNNFACEDAVAQEIEQVEPIPAAAAESAEEACARRALVLLMDCPIPDILVRTLRFLRL